MCHDSGGLIQFIEGFFHKHVRLRCDGEPATVALGNKVKHLAGDLVKFGTTPKHSSAPNPAERATQAVQEPAYKRAYGEHYTHEVELFAEVVLVRGPKPTHRGLHGGKRWGVWVEARRRTNTSFSRLEVVCFRDQFDDWNRLVDTILHFPVR